MWPYLLVILQLYGYLEGSEGQLLDTGSPVTTTASSTYVREDGSELSPELAVKGDLKRFLPNCFLSNQTSHPWFLLSLKSMTSIYNIRLRLPKTKEIKGVSFENELEWSVSISNSSTWDSNNGRICEYSWNYNDKKGDVNLQCENDLEGQFIYVSINSSKPTHLGICDIVINDQQPESSSPLNWSQDNANAVSSGFDATRPPSYAIDGISTSKESCSTITSTENSGAWLLVDMQTVRYIRKVTILYFHTSTDDFTIYVGRSLSMNGVDGNIRCNGKKQQSPVTEVLKNNYTFLWFNVTCSEPILGQYIYIETTSNPMRICEVEAFSNYLLNIYNSVNVTASDQANLYSSIWKPIDGVKGTSLNSAWISKSSSNSWWRMEFPHRYAVFRVVLHLPKLEDASMSKMLGSALYVGDSSVENGSQNSICGFLSRIQESGQFAIDCSSPSVGKYLFLSAANKSNATLFLSEISVVGCKVPTANSTDLVDSSDRMLQFDRPTCHGCMTKRVYWTNDGNSTMDNRSVSTVIVNAQSDDQSTKCVFRYVGGYGDALTAGYFQWSGRLEISQQNITIKDIGETYEVNCTATGNPQFTVQWIKLADMYDLHLSGSDMQTFNNSTTSNLKVESPDDGGKYRCIAKSSTGKKLARDIFVYVAPKVRLSKVPNLLFIGMTLGINCTILQGYPKPTLKLTSTNCSLCSRVNTSHSMAYNLTVPSGWLGAEFHCIAENGIGKDSERISFKGTSFQHWTARLNVRPQNMTILSTSSPSQFNCTATGFPNLTVRWVRVNDFDERTYLTNNIRNSNDSQTSILYVNDTKQSGRYQCIGTTKSVSHKGLDETVMVYIYGPPEIHLSTTPSPAAYGEKMNISCTVTQGYPIPNIILSPLCDSCKLLTANNSKYYSTTVTAAQVNKTIKCEANNTIGRSSIKLLHANIKPHVNLSASKNIVKIGDTFTLKCSTLGYPSPNASLVVPNPNQTIHTFTSQVKFELNVTVGNFSEEGGVYKCSSISSVGQTHKTVTIKVSPSVHLSPKNTTRTVGETLEVSCRGYGYPPPKMMIIAPNDLKSDYKSIKEVKLNLSIGDFAEEGGKYSCLATNIAGNASDHMIINVKPTAHLSVSSSETAIGETVVISCKGFGYPIPQVSLILPNGSFRNSTVGVKVEITVTIEELAEEGDKYRCLATNIAGNASDHMIRNVKPTAHLSVSSKETATGETVVISCKGFGYPIPQVSFILPNGSFRNSTVGAKVEITVAIEELAEEGDKYRCLATNRAGNASEHMIRNVKPTAHLSVSSSETAIGETVVISCRGFGYPIPQVSLILPDGSSHNSTVGAKVEITVAIEEHAEEGYEYRCLATNRAGNASEHMIINVKPTAHLSVSSKETATGETVVISCRGFGYPIPQVSLILPDGSSHNSTVGAKVEINVAIEELAEEGDKYRCLATNRAGNASELMIRNVKPTAHLSVSSSETAIGETVVISCRGFGYPIPQVSLILPNGSFHNSTVGAKVEINVTIGELAKEGGLYWCLSINSLGKSQENTTVEVEPRANISVKFLTMNIGQTLKVFCRGYGYPQPSLSLLLSNGTQAGIMAEQEIEWTVKIGSTAAEGGVYSCSAENSVGRRENNMTINVIPNINMTLSHERVQVHGRVDVSCSSFGYPRPVISLSMPNGTILNCNTTIKCNTTIIIGEFAEGGGTYNCSSRNSAAEVWINKTLYVPLVVTPPIFEGNSTKVNHGSNVTITCKVSGFPLFSDIVLLHGGLPAPIYPNETVFITKPSYKKTSFFINSVDVSHAGEYSCRLKSKVSTNVSLEVGPHFIKSPKALNVTEGGSTNLSCTATGSPVLTVKIVKEAKNTIETKVAPGSYENIITATTFWKNINRSDMGYYRCEADNDIGEAVLSDWVNVNVHYAPNAVIDSRSVLLNSSKDSFRNETLILNCTITGNPSPSVVWSKKPLGEAAASTSSMNVSYKASFTAESAITNDSGDYTCKAWNYLGSSSNTVRVTVQERPHSVKPITTSNVTARTVTVQWKTPFDGYNTIDAYIIHLFNRTGGVDSTVKVTQPYNYSTEYSFTAQNLRPFTFYDINVQAVNDLGGSNRNLTVTVQTKATAPGPATNVSVEALTSTKLIVTWGPPNEPNGKIVQYSVYHEVFENDNKRRRRERKNEAPITVPGNINQTVIKDLKTYTQYSVSIEAVSAGDNQTFAGARSTAVIIRTLEDKSSNPEILSVHLVQDQPTELTVTWRRPVISNGNITMYSVIYQEVGQSSNTTKNVSATGKETESASLTELLEYTNYSVQVRAISSSGIGGNLSLAVVGRTDEGKPSKPENFTVLDITDSSLKLKWEQPIFPRGIITKYQIEYAGTRQYTENGLKKTESQNTTKTVFSDWQTTVTKLMPSTEFEFTIFACTSKGPGNKTSKSATTDVAKPKQPILPKRTPGIVNNGTGLRITLVQPSNQYGNIIYVDVLVAKIRENDTTIFAKETEKEYNASFPENTLYITARFNYGELPAHFIIGDGENYGNYHNGPLEKGSMYFYALRSYTRDQQGKILFSTSKIGLGDLSIESKDSDSSSNTALIAAVAIIVIIIALVLILLFILYRRRREREEKLGRGSARHLLRPEETPMTNIEDAEIQKSAILGQTALLEVSDTGLKSTMVEWKLNGKELPGEDERIQVLQNGSLQIKDVKVLDYGVYECCEINSGNSGKLRLLVQMPNHGPKPVRLSETEQYVDEMHANDNWGFKSQYEMLPKGERHQYTAARMDHNRCKNRYGNIVPYDHSRVVLEGGPDYDYINASYMNGCDGPNVYIAAQGPTDNTIDDFWRMVWEKNVVSIVMVTNLVENGKVKCSKYWPDDENQYGDISVRLCRVLSVAEFFIRSFLVTKSESQEERSIKQFHFIAWPDHGVPSYPTSLLNLLKLVRNHQESSESTGPILVHCSAGVGRTGTYITIDNSLRQLKLDASLDIFNCISSMRENRPSMVQTENQYIFCHDAVLEYVLCGETSVAAHSLRARIKTLSSVDQEEGVSGYKKELKLLAKVSPSESSFTTTEASMPENLNKNRYRGNLPPDGCCVHLSPVVDKPAHFKYINACLLDAYRRRDYYITTQGPLENTVSDFWRMVWEKQCGAIVMLTSVEENGRQMSATYWPTSATLEAGFLTIKLDDETTLEEYTVRTFSIVSQEEETRTVLQFHMTKWPENRCPENATTILEIMGKVERTQQKSGDNPVIVMCNNGIDRSGTFCAIGIAIDRLKSEQVVDVFQAVKYLRTQNPKFLRKQQHYKFCYTACLEYLDSFDTYANFKEL